MHLFRCDKERNHCRAHNHRITRQVCKPISPFTQSGSFIKALDRRAQQHGAKNHRQQVEIPFANDLQGFDGCCIMFQIPLRFLAVSPTVPHIKDDEQDSNHKNPLRKQPERPREGDAAKKAKKEGRVTQRSQTTGNVAHDENKENGNMLEVLPLAIG